MMPPAFITIFHGASVEWTLTVSNLLSSPSQHLSAMFFPGTSPPLQSSLSCTRTSQTPHWQAIKETARDFKKDGSVGQKFEAEGEIGELEFAALRIEGLNTA